MWLGNSGGTLPFRKSPDDLTRENWKSLRGLRSSAAASEAGREGALEAIVDNLADRVALIDAAGRIAMVNKAWASTPHLGPFKIGEDYRGVCRSLAEQGHAAGLAVLEALDQFDEGRRTKFEYIYSVPGQDEERFFQFTLSNMVLQGRRFFALACHEITDVVLLERRNHELELEKLRIQQEEGRRIGRDIHDTTAQELAVLHLSLARLKMLHPDERSLEVFDDANDALTHIVDDIRAIAFMLHPPSLDQGLVEALDCMARGFARRTGLRIDFAFEGKGGPWDDDVEQVLYRIVQEALSNVYRHAAASNVRIRLIARRRALHVIVEDDGIGIAARAGAHHEPGVGIASMRSRIGSLAGRFSIRSLKRGTRVAASAPLRRQDPGSQAAQVRPLPHHRDETSGHFAFGRLLGAEEDLSYREQNCEILRAPPHFASA